MFYFFFFTHTASLAMYTLSLHDALPISDFGLTAELSFRSDLARHARDFRREGVELIDHRVDRVLQLDRKSTRLNSSHSQISYAVFCLKKQNADTVWMFQAESRAQIAFLP